MLHRDGGEKQALQLYGELIAKEYKQVEEEEPFEFSFDQYVAWDEYKIVNVEADADSKRKEASMHITAPIPVLTSAFEKQGREEDVAPRENVKSHFYT